MRFRLQGLNSERSKQLLQFLTNLTSLSQSKQSDQDAITTHMVGINLPSTTVYNSNAISCLYKLEVGSWILDSGASDHMSFDSSILYNLKHLENPVLVSLPNGYKVQVTHHGQLKIGDNLELNHVLLVPHFKYNLLSVKKLAAQLNCQVIFTENSCTLQGPSLKRPVEIGRESCGLYI